ncbi:MAG: DUF1102 domain-containing protein [Halorientalis sp.]
MRRRTLLMGMGGLAGAGGVVGTGAFTSVSAQRNVSVSVADDSSALLQLQPSTGKNGVFASTSNGQLTLDFSDTAAGGTGLGTDSVYRFDDVFTVTNQGTQPAGVWLSIASSTFDEDSFWFYPQRDRSRKLQGEGTGVVELGVGHTASIGVYIDTHGVDLNEWSVDVTVTADAEVESTATVTCPTVGSNEVLVSQTSCGDYSEIQPAVDAVAADASLDTVLIDSGTYSPSSNISIANTTTSSTLKLKGLTNGPRPIISNRGIHVESEFGTFEIDNVAIKPAAQYHGMAFDAASGNSTSNGTVRVSNCTIEGANQAIWFKTGPLGGHFEAQQFSLVGSVLTDNNGKAVRMANGTFESVLIDGTVVEDNASGGVTFDEVQSLSVTNSKFKSLLGIAVDTTAHGLSTSKVGDVDIERSTFVSNQDVGIKLQGGDNLPGSEFDITWCDIEHNGDQQYGNVDHPGIEVSGNVEMRIANSNVVDNAAADLLVDPGTGGTIDVDQCYFGADDISVTNQSSDATVTVTDTQQSELNAGYQSA